jgi:hypothetical protein
VTQDGQIDPPSLDINRHWLAGDSGSYAEVARTLLQLASGAASPDVRSHFALLAAMFEQLAKTANRLSESYVHMTLHAHLQESCADSNQPPSPEQTAQSQSALTGSAR